MLSALGRVSEVPVPKFDVEEHTLTFPELMTTGAECNSGPQGAGLVTNSFFILFCFSQSRFGVKKECFLKTHNPGSFQQMSWDQRALRGIPDGVLVSL